MWLTGFDVPSLATLYLDKPLKAHTLMQAIARANRVYEGKNNGLIVDYCGILKNLRKALATFATGSDEKEIEDIFNPVKPKEDLLNDLAEAIDEITTYLKRRGFRLATVYESTGFKRNAAIKNAKEIINYSEETRKRFEILAREVFKKFKACLIIKQVNQYKPSHDAIDIIYKKLQDDRAKADITDIIRELHKVVDDSIEPKKIKDNEEEERIYDISQINFERLKEEFKKSTRKNTTVQSLKNQVEQRLKQMIDKNPTRINLYQQYQEIIKEYNHEKDRQTIEQTFEALLDFIEDMDDEEKRTVREELNEENLALFDLL